MEFKSLCLVVVAAILLLHNLEVLCATAKAKGGKKDKPKLQGLPKKVCKPGECDKIGYDKLVKKVAVGRPKPQNAEGMEFRIKGFIRAGEDYTAFFNPKNISLGKWSVTDTCPVDTFADTADLYFADELEYMQHIPLGCSGFKRPPKTPRDVIESEAIGVRAENWKPCRGYKNAPKKALLVGIGFATSQPDDYHDHALTGLNFYCGNYNRIWKIGSPRSTRWNDVVCSPGNAICSIETQYDKGTDDNNYFTNVRVGCCSVPKEFWNEAFVYITEKSHDDIFLLQSRGIENPPLFGIKDPKTPFYHLYKRYTTQNTLPGQNTFTRSDCPKGSYVSGFEVTNPSSCFYNGDLIYKLIFTCTSGKTGEKTGAIDFYSQPFNNELEINAESTINTTFTCDSGMYDSAILTYYYNSRREHLVEGWSFGMHCTERDVEVFDTVTDFTTKPGKFEERGIVNCGYNFAICGFETAVSQGKENVGTPEGVFMKFICCLMER